MQTHRFVIDVSVDEIAAAHHLPDHPGECARLHGHNWSFSATIGADELHEDMVVDFIEVKSFFKALDHRLLNDVPGLVPDGGRPTAERIAEWLADRIQAHLDARPNRPRLLSVSVAETSRNRVTFTPRP